MLILSRRKDEKIIIDGRIEITIVEVKGDQVKLGIVAPEEVKIYRHEVFQAIEQENIHANCTLARDLPKIEIPR
ncbi:carbon storage regulator CsrA [Entomospira culicis]|uniref:Translational regulator CsrA n=1 Tax=Entomospira culicis TaxID=2719989 RepID=A0A968GLG3_9SPIO|nr:carbon storage regulator CsrA [Entomospira culicis]NIZ19756.1 carbon storage regulator CsrA [Entomospira culicis]NIZ69970.1 carbon storage regulator CsrA [Entomospira culicis]WDI37075.1 carbon storage regulator CsrA [Entomospira culicis]WDI38704.1 carbon storage regulator CsrA [Entomospira culicis]